jgi:hypothetical protein
VCEWISKRTCKACDGRGAIVLKTLVNKIGICLELKRPTGSWMNPEDSNYLTVGYLEFPTSRPRYMKMRLGTRFSPCKTCPFFNVESPWSAWTSSNPHIHRSDTSTSKTSRPTRSKTFYCWCSFPKIKLDNDILQKSCRKTRRYCDVERS